MENFKSFRFCSKRNHVSKPCNPWLSGNSTFHPALLLQAVQTSLILFTWQSSHTHSRSTVSQTKALEQHPPKGQVCSVLCLAALALGCPNWGGWVAVNHNLCWAPTPGGGCRRQKTLAHTSCPTHRAGTQLAAHADLRTREGSWVPALHISPY